VAGISERDNMSEPYGSLEGDNFLAHSGCYYFQLIKRTMSENL
jgi:hypothetical protein